jgi:hypothetical protein
MTRILSRVFRLRIGTFPDLNARIPVVSWPITHSDGWWGEGRAVMRTVPGWPARATAGAGHGLCRAWRNGDRPDALVCGGQRAVQPLLVSGDWLSGRAPRSHRGGHWFDPSIAHQVRAYAGPRRDGRGAVPVAKSAAIPLVRFRSNQLELEERAPSSRSQEMTFSCLVPTPLAASSGVPCA